MASIYLNSIKQEKMFNGVEIASLESLTYQWYTLAYEQFLVSQGQLAKPFQAVQCK
jgi:hypothetical protein